MGLFGKKAKKQEISFDPALQEPVVRRSICTGEMTVGLRDRDSGAFHELMLVRSQPELEAFCREIGVAPETVRTIY